MSTARAESWLCLMMRVTADRQAPGKVRCMLRVIGAQEGLRETVEYNAELLASEIVTNAVQAHERAGASGLVRVTTEITGGELCVSVFDEAPGVPEPKRMRGDAEGGRGLDLVESLAYQWCWTGRSGCKLVWFSLRLDMPDPEPDLGRWADAA